MATSPSRGSPSGRPWVDCEDDMRKTKRARAAASQRFVDGVMNPLLRVGQWAGNTFSATTYRPQFQTIKRQELEWAYQGSWMCGLAVDIVAEDMTREGIELTCEDPALADRIDRVLELTRAWDGICDAIKWSRLYGGAIAVMLIDGDDMSTPLGQVRPGSFKGLCVLDRWQVDVTGETVQELGPSFGKPKYYKPLSGTSEITFETGRIHHSRVLRFEGRRLPFYLRQAYQGWGASILENLFDRIKMYDLASSGAAQLLSKAYLRYYKVEGLRDILTNDVARKGFLKQMDIMREFQGIEGLTIGDTTDDFQTLQYTFTGIPEIMLQIGQQISGAIGVPLVRLFGQSPAGFNSTGESDLRIYYDNVKHDQDTDLRPGLTRLLDVIHQSVTGRTPGSDFGFEFRSLWQMTNEQKGQAAQTMSQAIIGALGANAITPSIAMRELRKLSDIVGVFSTITDEDVKEAEEADTGLLPPTVEDMTNGNNGGTVQGGHEVEADRGVVSQAPSPDSEAGPLDRPRV